MSEIEIEIEIDRFDGAVLWVGVRTCRGCRGE